MCTYNNRKRGTTTTTTKGRSERASEQACARAILPPPPAAAFLPWCAAAATHARKRRSNSTALLLRPPPAHPPVRPRALNFFLGFGALTEPGAFFFYFLLGHAVQQKPYTNTNNVLCFYLFNQTCFKSKVSLVHMAGSSQKKS